jgi:hypothetical protein
VAPALSPTAHGPEITAFGAGIDIHEKLTALDQLPNSLEAAKKSLRIRTRDHKQVSEEPGNPFESLNLRRLLTTLRKDPLMAQQNYRVDNAVGMWLRSQPVVDEASKIVLLPHGQLVTKTGDTNNPDWWQVATNYQNQNLNGVCKHSLMVPDAEFQTPNSENRVIEVHLERSQPVPRDQKGFEAFKLNETPHPSRNPNGTAQQKAADIGEIIAWLAVSQSARYRRTETETFCNIYAYDFSCLAGAFVPRVWWTPNAIQKLIAGQAVTPKYGVTVDEITANQIAVWFHNYFQIFGWHEAANLTELQRAANDGSVCIISARRVVGHGHICAIVPETNAHHAVWDNAHQEVVKPLTSQAGGHNFEYKPFVWWTDGSYRDLGFWIHA